LGQRIGQLPALISRSEMIYGGGNATDSYFVRPESGKRYCFEAKHVRFTVFAAWRWQRPLCCDYQL